MKPTHALAIAAALAVAAVLGVVAATKTSQLGATAKHASIGTIAARAHKLDSFEAALRKALLSKVPKLPKVPAVHAVSRAGSAQVVGSASVVSASAPRVIYHRAAPIIIHTHTHHGDDGSEAEAGGVHAGSFASGGGLDD
jgi:hypothetical protein